MGFEVGMAAWGMNLFALSIANYTSSGYKLVAQTHWDLLQPLLPGRWPLLKYT